MPRAGPSPAGADCRGPAPAGGLSGTGEEQAATQASTAKTQDARIGLIPAPMCHFHSASRILPRWSAACVPDGMKKPEVLKEEIARDLSLDRDATDKSLDAEREEVDEILTARTESALATVREITTARIDTGAADTVNSAELARSLSAAADNLAEAADGLTRAADKLKDVNDPKTLRTLDTVTDTLEDAAQQVTGEPAESEDENAAVTDKLAEVAENLSVVASALAEERLQADEVVRDERARLDETLREERRIVDD